MINAVHKLHAHVTAETGIEVERATLSAMFCFPACIPTVLEILDADHFRDEAHRKIFFEVVKHHQEGLPIELVAFASAGTLGKRDVEILAGLQDIATTGETARFYARKVHEAARRRQIASLAHQLMITAEEGADFSHLLTKLKEFEQLLVPSGLKVVNIQDLLQMSFGARESLLHPIITTQSLTMIHAWRGVGKTHIGLGIAYAVASGGTFLKWQSPQPREVLYLDGEMPGSALQERLAAIVAASEQEPDPDSFRIVTPDLQGPEIMPDLSTAEGQAAVNNMLTPSTALIVVDNISCLCRTGRENDAESWIPVQGWALQQRAAGRSVLFIHHSGKNGDQRGASKREDVLDTVIRLKRPVDYDPTQGAAFLVEFEKARHLAGDDAASFEARLATNPASNLQEWIYKDVALTSFDRVVNLANEGLSQHEIANELQLNKSNVCRHWKKAVEQGLIKSSKK